MKPASMDLRKRIVAARVVDGQTMGEIAEWLRIPKGTAENILERYRDSGSFEPKAQNAGRKPVFSGRALRRLEQDVLLHPDATLAELRERSGVKTSVVAVHNTLKRLGFTRKKSLYERTSSAGPTSSRGAKARAEKELWSAIAKALAGITPSDARGFFCHRGVGIIS